MEYKSRGNLKVINKVDYRKHEDWFSRTGTNIPRTWELLSIVKRLIFRLIVLNFP